MSKGFKVFSRSDFSLGVSTLARVLLPSCILLLADGATGCPAALLNLELNQQLIGSRQDLRLFAKSGARGQGWRPLAIQLDPVDENGRFIFFPDDTWRVQPIQKFDRMVFRTEDFGERLGVGERLPCRGAFVHELEDRQTKNRFAYLTLCQSGNGPLSSAYKPQAVAYVQDKHRLETKDYTYLFNPKNNMLFQSIFLAREGASRHLVAEESHLLIRSDIKKFFTLHFDSEEIESYLEQSRPGQIGTLARLSFYLKILFFKIKMSLSTDVTFYRDAGHIPMMVQLPVDAEKHLNPRSGILYSWIFAPGVQAMPRDVKMPYLRPETVRKGFKELAHRGLAACKGESCRYRLGVFVNGKPMAMEFEIARALVERGFFPHFVADVASHNDAMGWQLSSEMLRQKRVGLYFEVSGLPAGGSAWDFWLRLGGEGDLSGICPRGLIIDEIGSRSPQY